MTLADDNVRLVAENAELRALVAQVQEQRATAQQRIADLEQQRQDPPPFVKPNRPKPNEPKRPRKKRAPEHTHGRHRAMPTRIESHALDRCPECNDHVQGQRVDDPRQVVALPPPQPVEGVAHRVIKRWCPCGKAWRSPTRDLTGQVLGQGRIGVPIIALMCSLVAPLRVPIRRVQAYVHALHQLTLSAGEISALLHQARRTLQPSIDDLKRQARARPILHGDETSWRENGQNGSLWAFSTPGEDAVRSDEYDRARGQAVVKRILGGAFEGHLASDVYCGYNDDAGTHQRGWVHLLRDLHKLKQDNRTLSEVVAWAAALQACYEQAKKWLLPYPNAPREERAARYVELVANTHALGLEYATSYQHPCCALAKRLLRHEGEVFPFVLVAGLRADNNLAERSVRPLVIIRKISGGSRSEEGTKTRMGLASLCETWGARHLNPFEECYKLLSQPISAPAKTPLPQL